MSGSVKFIFAGVATLVLLIVLRTAFYTVKQTQQVIVTQFGKPVGDPVTEPGLHLKLPFIQTVNRIDKRFLEWDGAPVAISTALRASPSPSMRTSLGNSHRAPLCER